MAEDFEINLIPSEDEDSGIEILGFDTPDAQDAPVGVEGMSLSGEDVLMIDLDGGNLTGWDAHDDSMDLGGDDAADMAAL